MNCLDYALTKWVEEGGGLLFVSSDHWCIPHVQHRDDCGIVTEYKPPGKLKAPWYSLFGFSGNIRKVEHGERRRPQKILCLFVGMCILFVLGGIWLINRIYDYLKKKFVLMLK